MSTPILRNTAIEASRIRWYSLSVSVCAGATVIESPVCMPIGSRFSIEQMMMQLSLRSRTTSISNSFQPITDSSTSTSLVGEASRPRVDDVLEFLAVVGDAAAAAAQRERRPDDRREADLRLNGPGLLERMRGARRAAVARPMSFIACLKSSRSSAMSMASREAAMSSTPCCSSTPSRTRSSAQLSAVCPPIVGSSASGFSFSMIAATVRQLIGSM